MRRWVCEDEESILLLQTEGVGAQHWRNADGHHRASNDRHSRYTAMIKFGYQIPVSDS